MVVDIKGTNVARRNYFSTKRIVINRGGTRSGKTYNILLMFAKWLMTGEMRRNEWLMRGKATIVRKNRTTLTHTVLSDFKEIMQGYGFLDIVNEQKTLKEFSYDGRVIKFMGADEEQKLRGYSGDFLYCNEANELNYKKEFFQLNIRTKKFIVLDFNPSDPYVWINEELEQKRLFQKGDVDVIVSTYKDNLKNLPQLLIDEIEYLQVTDAALWKVYGLGEYGLVEGLILPDCKVIDKIVPIFEYKRIGAGMDFGFTNDYTAHYDCYYIPAKSREEKPKLFVDEIIYDLGMNGVDIKNRLIDLRYDKNRDIIADSAQPGTIKEIHRGGFNIKSAYKFKNSLKWGLDALRTFDVHVTARSQGLLKERKLYKWKQDKDGKWLNEPIDAHNHAFDAIRYYLMNFHSTGRKYTGDVEYA